MSKFTRKRGEQIREDIQREQRRLRSQRIDEAIQRGYSHLHDGNMAKLVTLMRDILLRDLNLSRYSLRDAADSVQSESAELFWNHQAVRSFVEDPDRYLETARNPGPVTDDEHASLMYRRAAGMSDPRARDREVIVDAFHSLESLAVARGVVSNSVTNWAPALGYELQVGTWYQPPRDDMPYRIQLVDPGDSEEVTVNMGKPGRGKGVMGHTEGEDRYMAGRKVIDLVDFDECEGGTWDIPNRNPVLREAREDMGLPPDFTGHDEYEEPELEIMVPMTDGLADEWIPYHGDGPLDTVVRPFTVPASSLSKRALKRFISAELTPTQVNVFESAYDEIQRSMDDWTLHDLITAVERHRGLHGNQGAVDRVQRAIRRVQSKGWIRSKDDPHCIQWDRILTAPDTITAFTASLMTDTDEAAQYLFHSYLLYALRVEMKRLKKMPDHQKEGWKHVPKLTVLMREIHKIAPNSETAIDDPTIREIQDAMINDFRDLTAMHRHEGVELICDTQNFIGEIKKRARKNFNRAALFQVNFSDAKEMFEEIAGEPRDKYPRRVTRSFSVGECAVLGRVGTGRSFEMTVSVAPPMSHHFDPDEWYHVDTGLTKDNKSLKKDLGGVDPARANPDGWESIDSGWDLRVYLKGEEYRPAGELLEAFGVDNPEETSLETVRRELSDERPDDGPGQFAWDCLEPSSSGQVILDRLEAAYVEYAEEHDHPERYDARSQLCQSVGRTHTPEDDDKTFSDHFNHSRPVLHGWEDDQHQTPVYKGVVLTEDGEGYAPDTYREYEAIMGDGDPRARNGDEYSGREDSATDGDSTDGSAPDDSLTQLTESVSEPSDATDADPAVEDVDCGCSPPEPVPMYAGDSQDQQVGWKCEKCGQKEWN